ncbi:serine hydrolase domain-containing protein [Polymorphobacter fuscus]|uniref:serine hydrolase domain-containing protein n=1 Tax=Sandarakinorhabdus fusca TaxID=1439888 RepID=UPI0014318A2A|nr:serine hydrolase domain-containing protein [Polymorphobacter fuscus]NJC09089.1 beta-lactamase class C [Polymorphobacter fuscus]
MRRGTWLVVLVVLILVAVAVGLALRGGPVQRTDAVAIAAPRAATGQPLMAPAAVVDYQQLDARLKALMQEPDMVGLAVGTIEAGQVRFVRAYGETLAQSKDPVTPDTVFRWASLSKSIASAVVVGLAAEGKLSLDAPLATLGTTLALPGGTRAITVADVLSHRLGLPHNAWDDRLEAGEDPRMLRASFATLKPECPPATCYAYQNIAYDTATEVVERVTGRDYATVARARLFVPLGMDHATIGRQGLESAASWARPHRHNKVSTTVNDSYYRVPAAGGVNSSIRDLLRWMGAQMGDAPAVLSPASLDMMHRSRVPTPPHRRRGAMDRALADPAYGLGWRTYRYAGHALVGHRGSVDGYGSLILFDPAARSGIVMLWNSNTAMPARAQLEFFDLLYGLPRTDWLALSAPPAPPARADAEVQTAP